MKRRAGKGARATDANEYSARLDASFFNEHPSCRSRIRPYVLHEFWPLDRRLDQAICSALSTKGQPLLVHVMILDNGRRVRETLFDFGSLNALAARRN